MMHYFKLPCALSLSMLDLINLFISILSQTSDRCKNSSQLNRLHSNSKRKINIINKKLKNKLLKKQVLSFFFFKNN